MSVTPRMGWKAVHTVGVQERFGEWMIEQSQNDQKKTCKNVKWGHL